MEIRPYQQHDERGLLELWTALSDDTAPHNAPAAMLREKLAVDRDLLLVAECEGRVIGAVMGGYDGHRGWVYALAVQPDHQRRGVGSALVRQLEAALQQRGCLKINLQVREANAAVVAFYEKLGYAVEPRVSMGKRLY